MFQDSESHPPPTPAQEEGTDTYDRLHTDRYTNHCSLCVDSVSISVSELQASMYDVFSGSLTIHNFIELINGRDGT